MFSDKALSFQNLKNFDFEGTKKNIYNYFMKLEKLQWEWAKLNAQRGVTADYDFEVEYKKQPYSPVGQDEFALSAKEDKEKQLREYISSYYWAKSVLSDKEQLYIAECFLNHKYEDEIIELLGFASRDNKEFRKLKKSAVYKFADVLDLVVEKA